MHDEIFLCSETGALEEDVGIMQVIIATYSTAADRNHSRQTAIETRLAQIMGSVGIDERERYCWHWNLRVLPE